MDTKVLQEPAAKRKRAGSDLNAATTTTTTTTAWHLYPHHVKNVTTGDLVYIRSKSAKAGKRGRVMQVTNQDGRAIVRLQHSEHETFVPLKRLVPVYDTERNHGATVILTSDTFPYRHLAASQITLHDHVLEIGCSTGEASAIMMKSTPQWIGLDVSSEIISQARLFLQEKGHDIVNRVVKLDVLIDPSGAEKHIRQYFPSGPTVVFIDIGGNRNASSAIRVLYWCVTTFHPRLVVMKNREMVQECIKDCSVINGHVVVHGANDWFHTKHATIVKTLPEHPLQACMVLSPVDDITPICRYHNYHSEGCKKAEQCPFDHYHCHVCRQAGHTAKKCPTRKE